MIDFLTHSVRIYVQNATWFPTMEYATNHANSFHKELTSVEQGGKIENDKNIPSNCQLF